MEDREVTQRTQKRKDIRSMDYEQLQQEMAALGEKPFRAKQLYQWMHEKLAGSFEEMTNLPKSFREKLKEQYDYTVLTLEDRLISGIDGTEKYLFGLEDGNVIEFLNLNKDKNIRVEYIGDRTYKTTMSPTDRQAAAGVYELAQILSAMEQIKKEQEEANLKIGFINKKKERKAQEEITD